MDMIAVHKDLRNDVNYHSLDNRKSLMFMCLMPFGYINNVDDSNNGMQ